MPPSPRSSLRTTITQRLAAELAEKIVAGKYRPGAPLRENDLTTLYGVSRHVVREVLRILAADGLVDYASFKGARVPVLAETDARDIYRGRRMVECGPEALSALPDPRRIRALHEAFSAAAARGDFISAFNLDLAFHGAISAAAGSPRATAWLDSLMQALRLAHLVAPSFNQQVVMDSIDQHAAILAAIEAGDSDRAREAMRQHLDAAEQALIAGMAPPNGPTAASSPAP